MCVDGHLSIRFLLLFCSLPKPHGIERIRIATAASCRARKAGEMRTDPFVAHGVNIEAKEKRAKEEASENACTFAYWCVWSRTKLINRISVLSTDRFVVFVMTSTVLTTDLIVRA